MAECSRLQHRMTKSLGNLEESVLLEGSHNRHSLRRLAWIDVTELNRSASFMKKLGGALNYTELDIWSRYWLYVAWMALVAAIDSPVWLSNDFFYKYSTWNLLDFCTYDITVASYFVMVPIIVMALEYLNLKKIFAINQISKLVIKNRQDLKHQLLALHHRFEPANCFLFGIDYALLNTILDSTLLITCLGISS
ncbi:hypothetical protein J6590_081374 [Homalodisca vitripennis]|nr:hypothetical protein J6590_081374 [Homalodisca vitripennis]